MSNIWHKNIVGPNNVVYYADRKDGTEMTVTAHRDGTHTVLVVAPDGLSEYLDGEIPDTTANACIARAESVRLPEEDTGI